MLRTTSMSLQWSQTTTRSMSTTETLGVASAVDGIMVAAVVCPGLRIDALQLHYLLELSNDCYCMRRWQLCPTSAFSLLLHAQCITTKSFSDS